MYQNIIMKTRIVRNIILKKPILLVFNVTNTRFKPHAIRIHKNNGT